MRLTPAKRCDPADDEVVGAGLRRAACVRDGFTGPAPDWLVRGATYSCFSEIVKSTTVGSPGFTVTFFPHVAGGL